MNHNRAEMLCPERVVASDPIEWNAEHTPVYTGSCSFSKVEQCTRLHQNRGVATNPIESSRNLLSKHRTASRVMIVFLKAIRLSYEKEDNIWIDSEAQKM